MKYIKKYLWLPLTLGISSFLLYIYNFIYLENNPDLLTDANQANLNRYFMVGFVALGIYLIFKLLVFLFYTRSTRIWQVPTYDDSKITLYDNSTNNEEQLSMFNNYNENINDSRCPNCGSPINKNADVCINCGKLLKQKSHKYLFDIIQIIVVIILIYLLWQGIMNLKEKNDAKLYFGNQEEVINND